MRLYLTWYHVTHVIPSSLVQAAWSGLGWHYCQAYSYMRCNKEDPQTDYIIIIMAAEALITSWLSLAPQGSGGMPPGALPPAVQQRTLQAICIMRFMAAAVLPTSWLSLAPQGHEGMPPGAMPRGWSSGAPLGHLSAAEVLTTCNTWLMYWSDWSEWQGFGGMPPGTMLIQHPKPY